MILMLCLALVVFALLGAPLFTVLAGAAMLGFWHDEIPLTVMGVEIYRIVETPVLLALPLFTYAGYILGEGQTSHRLVRLTRAFLGWLPGGLAIVAFTTCAFFTAFTGASGATIVAMGALLYPALRQAGYDERFSLGLVTTSGSLGLLLPPSLPLILYAIIAQQMPQGAGVTIDAVFRAGLFPALLMVALLSLFGYWVTKRRPVELQPFCWRELGRALVEAKWELPLPVFVLGGIYGGVFAVSEAAAVTALYVTFVSLVVYREVRLTRLIALMREAMVMVGGILLILAVATALTNWFIDAEVPSKLFALVKQYIDSKWAFLLLLNVFLLILGCFLDIFSALVIMVPLLLPMAAGFGIHPVHLGIIFLANMEIGYCTPPVGMNLMIASYRFKKPMLDLAASTLPFLGVLMVAVLIITFVPVLSLALL
ncbi:tripartite ATP-independent transporter DctM subunit [Fluviicoccus keumensis]|uniref:TRAP transporter large permease protein n=1 Tax=Fluviicoccus keumensis TaxID=1435465 RepID=A0A4Q7ZC93_9GAMM|nr:TRAP transporter large permease subunit [Fluviicoccus keumensis]RZU47585.1 tripartite ATP-independent transporter DctM subunit [Fluviicoccus keumensis]